MEPPRRLLLGYHTRHRSLSSRTNTRSHPYLHTWYPGHAGRPTERREAAERALPRGTPARAGWPDGDSPLPKVDRRHWIAAGATQTAGREGGSSDPSGPSAHNQLIPITNCVQSWGRGGPRRGGPRAVIGPETRQSEIFCDDNYRAMASFALYAVRQKA